MDQTLGVWLRETREAKGSTPEDTAAATRIRPRFLEMMEEGNFAAFPGGELQIRGFLRIVARYLELPADEVLARYDSEFRGVEPEKEPDEPAVAAPVADSESASVAWRPLAILLSSSGRSRGGLATWLIWGAVLIVTIGIGASIAYLVTQRGGGQASAAMPTPALTQTAEVPEVVPQPTAIPTMAPAPQVGVTVALEATEHVWIRVTADGRIAYVGFLAPEEVKTWSGDERVLVETGNGAGLQVTVNERPEGALGARGMVSSRAWGPAGEIEPA